MASEEDHKRYMEKKNECRLFGVDLTPRYNILSRDDDPVTALGGETRAYNAWHNEVQDLSSESERGLTLAGVYRNITVQQNLGQSREIIFSGSMASEGDHKRYMEKKNECRLFGVNLTPGYNILSRDDDPVTALGGETRAYNAGHNEVQDLSESERGSTLAGVYRNITVQQNLQESREIFRGSMTSVGDNKRCTEKKKKEVADLQGSKNDCTQEIPAAADSKDSEGCVFPCHYCGRKFYDRRALGGHQNAHKKERATSKSTPILHRTTDFYEQYHVADFLRTSSSKLSPNSELPHFDPCSHKFPAKETEMKRDSNEIRLALRSSPSVKRVRNEDPQQQNTAPSHNVTLGTENVELDLTLHLGLALRSLPSVKRVRSEDPQQQNTAPGHNVTLGTEDVELDLTLHL